MIPVLNQFGKQAVINNEPLWEKTLADTELQGYDDLYVTFGGERIPMWDYIEKFCRIKDQKTSQIVAFKLNSGQIELYKAMCRCKRERGKVRLNVGKGRQMGSSTLFSAIGWCNTVFYPGRSCGIIADTEEHGVNLLETYKTFYKTSPEYIKNELKKRECANNSKKLAFDYGSAGISSFSVLVAGNDNDNAGVSMHFTTLHESEVAIWPNPISTLSKMEQGVSKADEGSIIIRETTARGPNEWKEIYESGKFGRGSFVSIFLGWYMHEIYKERYDGHDLLPYEEMLMKKHGCSLEQCQFWRTTFEDCGQSYTQMAQEYPADDIEMFKATSTNIFNAEIIANRKEEIAKEKPPKRGYFTYSPEFSPDGNYITLRDIRWFDSPNGSISIYMAPEDGHPYVLCNDPAKGGRDYHASIVCDNSNMRQVAVFHAQGQRCDIDEASYQSYLLLHYYEVGGFDETGKSLKSVSVNRVGATGENNTTVELLRILQKLGIRNIPYQRDDLSEAGSIIAKLGYRTTVSNRQPMISDAQTIFRESAGRVITDYDTICEFETFQYQQSGRMGGEKAMAVGNAHDDLVMAYVGYCHSRGLFPVNVERKSLTEDGKPRFDPFSYMGKDKSKKGRFIEW